MEKIDSLIKSKEYPSLFWGDINLLLKNFYFQKFFIDKSNIGKSYKNILESFIFHKSEGKFEILNDNIFFEDICIEFFDTKNNLLKIKYDKISNIINVYLYEGEYMWIKINSRRYYGLTCLYDKLKILNKDMILIPDQKFIFGKLINNENELNNYELFSIKDNIIIKLFKAVNKYFFDNLVLYNPNQKVFFNIDNLCTNEEEIYLFDLNCLNNDSNKNINNSLSDFGIDSSLNLEIRMLDYDINKNREYYVNIMLNDIKYLIPCYNIDTIRKLKILFKSITNLDILNLDLYYNSTILLNNKTLNYYSINKGSVLFVKSKDIIEKLWILNISEKIIKQKYYKNCVSIKSDNIKDITKNIENFSFLENESICININVVNIKFFNEGIKLFQENTNKSKIICCKICEFEKPNVTIMPCEHTFCSNCFEILNKEICSYCKQIINEIHFKKI